MPDQLWMSFVTLLAALPVSIWHCQVMQPHSHEQSALLQSPESLEDMHMGRDIRHMSMQSSRSMPNELFLDQVRLMAKGHDCPKYCQATVKSEHSTSSIVMLMLRLQWLQNERLPPHVVSTASTHPLRSVQWRPSGQICSITIFCLRSLDAHK